MQQLERNWGIKSSHKGHSAWGSDVENFSLFSGRNQLKDFRVGTGSHTFGRVAETGDNQDIWTTDIVHGLGYNPLTFLFDAVPTFWDGSGEWTYWDAEYYYLAYGLLNGVDATTAATWYAQSFIAPRTGIIGYAGGIAIKKDSTPPPDGDAKARMYIYNDDAYKPGTSIGQIGQIVNDQTYYQTDYVPCTDKIEVVEGTRYWVVVKELYGWATYKMWLGYDAGAGYAGGVFRKTVDSGANWTGIAGDMVFTVYIIPNPGGDLVYHSAPHIGSYHAAGIQYPNVNTVRVRLAAQYQLGSYSTVYYAYRICIDPNKENWF